MAISTYQVFLMKGAKAVDDITYSKLIDIKDFPDLGGAPEMLETTTLSDSMQTFIKGIQSLGALEFTANYTIEDYQLLNDLSGIDTHYAVYFGASAVGEPDGHSGKFVFSGDLSVYPVGAGANSVIDMKLNITPSTPIVFDDK